ncbi:hypothetical protein [Streptacidiphilus albus]|uniref:hypothetical protein n=1 Tax=Streptacidiphilus albus TaxID=105425 RepID=UPI00128CAA5C|nr:hypothetical protein [Streptacidiphilus albus]
MTAIVCLVLSAVAVVLAVTSGTARRWRRAVRWAALALVPTGLYLTGLLTMFDRIGHAVADWAANLVFNPGVWAGAGMLGAAAVVLLLTGVGRSSGSDKAVPKAADRPAAPTGRSGNLPAVTAAKPAGKSGADDGLGDFADVEEILKRRGL